ncbi:MAG: DUF177 domain-containing protein [Chloroflexota bacterium]
MLSYNCADLLRAEPGTTEYIDIALADLVVGDDVELAQPVRGRIQLSQSGRGILLRGHLDTTLAERCSRCLRPAKAHVSVDIEEEALPLVDLESGALLDATEEPEALRLDDHHELDIEATVRDAISLAEPIAPLCRPDCPGLCGVCGVDLAADPKHAHQDDDIDPRLAALAGLRDRLQ